MSWPDLDISFCNNEQLGRWFLAWQHVAIADQNEANSTIPQTFVAKYIWSQDHKVIAIQYGLTASLSAWSHWCCRA